MTTLKLFTSPDNKLRMTTTTPYSYRNNTVNILSIFQTIPTVKDAGFYIYNATNVALKLNPLFNVFPDQSLPDAIYTTTTVTAGSAVVVPIPSDYLFVNYFSIQITPASTPTGYVTGFAIINYNYTVD